MSAETPFKLWTMAGDLSFVVTGSVIKRVWLPHWYKKRLRQKMTPKGQISPGSLKGWRFTSVEPYGKSLLFRLENIGAGTRYMACTLGRGQWLIKDINAYLAPWTPQIYMVFELSHPEGYDYCLLFSDTLHQGVIEIREHLHDLDLLHRYGPPIDSPYFTRDWLSWVCLNSFGWFKGMEKAYRIKSLLLQQRYFAGMSNKMAVETLFLANLHPEALAKDLDERQLARLYHAILVVYGSFSTADHDFMIWRKVTCPVCEGKIERMIGANNHKTYFCPTCQAKDFRPPEPISEEYVAKILEVSKNIPVFKRGVDVMNENNRLRILDQSQTSGS